MNDSSTPEDTQVPKKWLFHGDAKEYFGIWLSNLVLTIVTLGIFSAWAKVRRNRYMMGNIEIAGSVLQYHATGGKIFIGRVIAVALLLTYSMISESFPKFSIPLLIAFAGILPWLIDRGMAFRCRMVSWHNIHFRWIGSYSIVLKGMLPLFIAFLPYLIVADSLVTAAVIGQHDSSALWEPLSWLGMAFLFSLCLYPWASRSLAQTIVNNIAWGSLRFKNAVTLKRYGLRVLVQLYLAMIVGYLLIIAMFIGIGVTLVFHGLDYPLFIIIIAPTLLIFFAVYRAFRGMIRELLMNTTEAHDLQDENNTVYLHAQYSWWQLFWLELSNFLVSVMTLSLMVPWARIRREKYLAEHSAIGFSQDPEAMLDVQQEENSSLAAEYTDIDGFDFDPW